jgi:hypothetical protein
VTHPRIYADFNGLRSSARTPGRRAVALDTFGTLRDLSNAGLRLHEGDPLVVYDWSDENEDLEGHGTTYFDAHMLIWFVELDERGVLYVPAHDRTRDRRFLCLECRADFEANASDAGVVSSRAATCGQCGTPIDEAFTPPKPTESP